MQISLLVSDLQIEGICKPAKAPARPPPVQLTWGGFFMAIVGSA